MRYRNLTLSMLICCLWLVSNAHAAPGDLDPSFDGDGRMTFQPRGLSGFVTDCLIDKQGRIVVVGTVDTAGSQQRMAVARVLPNGGLDPSFGVGGVALANFRSSGQDRALAVALDSLGRIVVCGSSSAVAGFALAFFLPDGSPDFSMGSTGVMGIPVGCSDQAQARDLLVQPDGKIVAAGNILNSGGNPEMGALARIMPGGALDVTFGTGDGMFGGPVDFTNGRYFYGLARHTNGRLVAAGYHSSLNRWVLMAFDAAGFPDFGFGTGGEQSFSMGSLTLGAVDVAVRADGSILSVGTADDLSGLKFAAAKVLSSGILDGTFDGDGKVLWSPSPFGHDFAEKMALLPDGRFLTVGEDATGQVIVSRSLSNGTPDGTFGSSGAVVLKLFGTASTEGARAVKTDASGRIVVCGVAGASWGVARLVGDAVVGAPDPTLQSPDDSRIAIAGANPFSNEAAVEFSLETRGEFSLDVYDVSGAKIQTIARGTRDAGRYQESWDGRDAGGRLMPSGMYFFRLVRDGETLATKAIKLR